MVLGKDYENYEKFIYEGFPSKSLVVFSKKNYYRYIMKNFYKWIILRIKSWRKSGTDFLGNPKDSWRKSGTDFLGNPKDSWRKSGTDFLGNPKDSWRKSGTDFLGNPKDSWRKSGTDFLRESEGFLDKGIPRKTVEVTPNMIEFDLLFNFDDSNGYKYGYNAIKLEYKGEFTDNNFDKMVKKFKLSFIKSYFYYLCDSDTLTVENLQWLYDNGFTIERHREIFFGSDACRHLDLIRFIETHGHVISENEMNSHRDHCMKKRRNKI